MSEIEHWSSQVKDHQGDHAGGGSSTLEITAAEDETGSSGLDHDQAHSSDDVYVAVGEGTSSMDALSWALQNAVAGSKSCVYLVHVFPEVRRVPTPLGHLPKNQVNLEQLENYMAQVRAKRREMLQKFISCCNYFGVNNDTILVESDKIPEAVIELVQVLHVQNLVFGVSKRKFKKGIIGIGGKVQKEAPGHCNVKIICEGKEASTTDATTTSVNHSPKSPSTPELNTNKERQQHEAEEKNEQAVRCPCFTL